MTKTLKSLTNLKAFATLAFAGDLEGVLFPLRDEDKDGLFDCDKVGERWSRGLERECLEDLSRE